MAGPAVIDADPRAAAAPGVDVTILMPCLDERITLPACIDSAEEAVRRLAVQGLTAEILISDNGSVDGSQAYARSRGCRVTECPRRGSRVDDSREGRGARKARRRMVDASGDFAGLLGLYPGRWSNQLGLQGRRIGPLAASRVVRRGP